MCETFDIGITCSLNVLRSSYVEPLSLFYLCHVSESSWGGGGVEQIDTGVGLR